MLFCLLRGVMWILTKESDVKVYFYMCGEVELCGQQIQ